MPPEPQSWPVEALAEPDAYRALCKLVAWVATIHARIAPMIGVFSAVAQDPPGAIYQQSEDLRRADMTRLADTLAAKTPLRQGMARRRAAELLFVLIGPALYRDCPGSRMDSAGLDALGHQHSEPGPAPGS